MNSRIVVCTPIHPDGVVLADWADHTFNRMNGQFPPGMRHEFYCRNEGEDCATAYIQLVRHAQKNGILYIFFLEDDIYLPGGAIAKLWGTLNAPQNRDVAGIGAMYSWRSGPFQDWNLVFREDSDGPALDFEPGEIIEVDACGQGAFLLRTHALTDQPEPWFALDWCRDDDPIVRNGAADLFFFRKLRTGICPHTQKPWRILCDTGVTCEHQDRTSKVVYPRSEAFRKRWGYPVRSELVRKLEDRARGRIPVSGSIVSPTGLTAGVQPKVAPPASVSRPPKGKPAPANRNGSPFRILNIGWGGVPVRSDVMSGLAHLDVQVDRNEIASTAAFIEEKYGEKTEVIGDCWKLPVPDESYDLIYVNHVIEHLPVDKIVPALREWMRVTRGKVFIGCPDIGSIGQFVRDEKLDVVLYEAGGMQITPRLMLWGGQRYKGDFHLNGFTEGDLKNYAYKAGIGEREIIVTRQTYELRATIYKGEDAVSIYRQMTEAHAHAPQPA